MRARAYAADALGHPDEALRLLEDAQRLAERLEVPWQAAIAKYQRGRRPCGHEGAALIANARAIFEAHGLGPALLDEDVGYRN